MTTDPNELIVGYGEADGLTKREYFAALAMQGLLASERVGEPGSVRHPGNVADLAVDQADELIASLNSPYKGNKADG
ncbi:hypothetical protein [Nodosilinea sp. FACHB-13]|uniref:hypothetical protein n=1 Tax=Cyanophyceae TaxID=3028117 RepID=UPI001687D879|nr:hypothetical protein [Nodosilinea sp. FACHB-13]MBD2107414.1 hypothetical protein [Nodosilinea sp. FACHB-13]